MPQSSIRIADPPPEHRLDGLGPGITNDVRLKAAIAMIDAGDIEVVSVDVFDTVLWRRVAEPIDAFTLVGARLRERGLLSLSLASEEFGRLRQMAEVQARQCLRAAGGGVETTLPAIYDQMPPNVFAPNALRPAVIDAELDVERELLVPDLDIYELLRHAQDRGRRLIAVSDTYFSEADVRSFMDRPPISGVRFERVFVSSAHGVGKGTALFPLVLRHIGVEPGDVLHIGDNREADVTVPSRLGIATTYFDRRPARFGRIVDRERRYPRTASGTGDQGLTSLRAKVLHRQEHEELPESLRPYWRFGVASLGPVLTGFADWVHARAADHGVTKVFCLMREGELLADLINAASSHLDSDIEAEPIWLSRHVCARASIMEGTRAELEELLERRRAPTVRELCESLEVDETGSRLEDMRDARLDDLGVATFVLDELSSDGRLRAQVLGGAAQLRERLVRSMLDRLPPGESKLVFVDLGWGATIQAAAQLLLRGADSDVETVGLYLVTQKRAAERVLAGRIAVEGFVGHFGLPDPNVTMIMRSPEILEQISMPEHGSQIGLDEELLPVLAPWSEPERQTIQRRAVQNGVRAFQREWARYQTVLPAGLPTLHDGARHLLLDILTRAVAAPTEEEAAIFGPWLHDENFGSARTESVASSTTGRALRHLDPEGLFNMPMGELYWPFGLAVMHDEQLARAADVVATGALGWDAFSSVVETGEARILTDNGWGFESGTKAVVRPRRNRLGLSYLRSTLPGESIRAVRIELAQTPCVIRLDWLAFHCSVRHTWHTMSVTFDDATDLSRLRFVGCKQIAPQLLMVSGRSAQILFDVEEAVGGPAYEVTVECAFAVLPLPKELMRKLSLGTRIKQRAIRFERRTGVSFTRPLRRLLRGLRGSS